MIRMAIPDDAEEIRNIYAPFVLETATSFETVVPRVEDMKSRISTILKEAPWLVYETDGVIRGYAYAGQHRQRAAYQWTREVSVYLSPEVRRKGVGTNLYKHLFELLEKQGYTNMLAGITLPNPASLALHFKLGFKEVGTYQKVGFKNNRFWDVMWLGKPIPQPKPGRILSLKEIG